MSSYVDYASSSKGAAITGFFGLADTFDTYLWSQVYSQEIVLNSRQEGPWRWSGGLFYRDAEDTTDQFTFGPHLDHFSDFSEQIAVFGEVGRRFWDQWEWSLGLRYFHDETATQSNDNTIPGQANLPPFTRLGEDSFQALTPRAVLTWHPREDFMVYGTYGQGFRSGAAQTPLALNVAPQFPSVKSDKLHNYEVGAKGDVLGGRLSLETAVYFIDWQDTQQVLQAPVPGVPGVMAVVLANASSASGLGMDVALAFRPLQGLEIGASYSTNDLTFDEDVFSGVPPSLLFSKGDRLDGSPEYTVSPFVAYSFPLGAGGYRGRFSADATYVSPANQKKLGDPNGVDGDPVTLARAGFILEAPRHWNAGLTVDNLNNYQGSAAVLSNVDVFQWFSYRERPRTVNLQFEYQFAD
jgi:iron complex outermembrane recepter protein